MSERKLVYERKAAYKTYWVILHATPGFPEYLIYEYSNITGLVQAVQRGKKDVVFFDKDDAITFVKSLP